VRSCAFKITITVKTLPVNFGDLALALQDQGGELHVYYFDTETGAVLNLSEDFDQAQLHEIREEGFGRFLRIEPEAVVITDIISDMASWSGIRSWDGTRKFCLAFMVQGSSARKTDFAYQQNGCDAEKIECGQRRTDRLAGTQRDLRFGPTDRELLAF
jgi:hypothetical protein